MSRLDNQEICRNCIYFNNFDTTCRFNPPVMVIDRLGNNNHSYPYAVSPSVVDTYWCGRFKNVNDQHIEDEKPC